MLRTIIVVLALFAFTVPAHARHHHRHHHTHHHFKRTSEAPEGVVGGRPSGCPGAFCGCGASLYLFGRIIPALNLAANWLRFPHVMPAPRMAAARRHHVMVLLEHRHDSIWLVYDANSGHHQTRIHERSIAGYQIVEPHA